MKRFVVLLLFVSIAASCAEHEGVAAEAASAMAHFSKPALRAHMEFLADDLLEGRGTGTRGHEIATRYIAARFEAAGLEPAGTNGSYFQPVPFREITIDPAATEVSIARLGHYTKLVWAQDFVARGNELSTDVSVEAPVVFVGYGVVNPARGYDDYAGVDVNGKIVAILFGGPPSFPAEERAHFASFREKARIAAARGAVGMVGIWTPESETILPWKRAAIGAEFPAFRWLDPQGQPNDSFPTLKAGATLSTVGAQQLFAGADRSWDDVLKDAAASKPQPLTLPVMVRIHLVSKHREVKSPNVAGVLRGSDPRLANEYVVYSAHSDHLGIGRALNGDSIYNGAVDDGSGISALLEMANTFAKLPARPARSILFLAVTAEEKGLLGSDYFAHFPTVPIGNIVANLNMDGMSVFYTFKDIVPLGAEHTTLSEVVERDAQKLGLKVSPDPMPEQVNFVRSDHYSFVRQGVPAITISEGLQAKDPKVNAREFVDNWIATRYHSPSDDMQQPLDFDAAVQFMQVNFLVGYDLAQQRARPAWKPGDFFSGLYGSRR